MKKYHIILLLLLGLLFTPVNVMACGMDKSKHTCEKENTTNNTDKKCCCVNDNLKENENKGCDGNCKNSKCGCSSTYPPSSISFLPEIIFKTDFICYSLIEKVKFSYTTPSISDGFYSIWLIPKIG